MFYKAWLNCIWLCSSCKTIEDINYAYNPGWRKRERRNNACARLMLISARTAPKTAGVDDIFTAIVSEGGKEQLAAEMEKIAEERRIVAFKRDGTKREGL